MHVFPGLFDIVNRGDAVQSAAFWENEAKPNCGTATSGQRNDPSPSQLDAATGRRILGERSEAKLQDGHTWSEGTIHRRLSPAARDDVRIGGGPGELQHGARLQDVGRAVDEAGAQRQAPRLADDEDRIAVVDDVVDGSSRSCCPCRRFRRSPAAAGVPAGSSRRPRRRRHLLWPRPAPGRCRSSSTKPGRAGSTRPAKKLLSPMNSPTKRLAGRW